jgi:hypothetical protein
LLPFYITGITATELFEIFAQNFNQYVRVYFEQANAFEREKVEKIKTKLFVEVEN